jgi:peptidoglycan glycosyltransferase
MSGVVGFSSPYYGNWAASNEYNSYLAAHALPPQSFEQLLSPTSAADSVTLTIDPGLQQVARTAMKGIDGAAVALDPKTGGVLVMYSNPNYNPVPLTSPIRRRDRRAASRQQARWQRLRAVRVRWPRVKTFPPGSTFKVITTAAAVVSKPADLTKDFESDRDNARARRCRTRTNCSATVAAAVRG